MKVSIKINISTNFFEVDTARVLMTNILIPNIGVIIDGHLSNERLVTFVTVWFYIHLK